MRYVIEYEHLKDDLVTDELTQWQFDKVKESANKYKLELTDAEFNQFLKLRKADKDIDWLMHKMGAYRLTFTDALISYITY